MIVDGMVFDIKEEGKECAKERTGSEEDIYSFMEEDFFIDGDKENG